MNEIKIQDLQVNPFTLFSEDWMVLAAGNEQDGYNAMTVAWGHLGSIWERGSHRNCLPTSICYVRPSRYNSIANANTFVVAFYSEIIISF